MLYQTSVHCRQCFHYRYLDVLAFKSWQLPWFLSLILQLDFLVLCVNPYYWLACLWRAAKDVSHHGFLSADIAGWWFVQAALCRWWCCCMADQLWRPIEDAHNNNSVDLSEFQNALTMTLTLLNFSSRVLKHELFEIANTERDQYGRFSSLPMIHMQHVTLY